MNETIVAVKSDQLESTYQAATDFDVSSQFSNISSTATRNSPILLKSTSITRIQVNMMNYAIENLGIFSCYMKWLKQLRKRNMFTTGGGKYPSELLNSHQILKEWECPFVNKSITSRRLVNGPQSVEAEPCVWLKDIGINSMKFLKSATFLRHTWRS